MKHLETLQAIAGELVSRVAQDPEATVLAVDGTNPNAISMLFGRGGVPLPQEVRDLLGHALVFAVVPSDRGVWITFFPAEKAELNLESVAQEGE